MIGSLMAPQAFPTPGYTTGLFPGPAPMAPQQLDPFGMDSFQPGVYDHPFNPMEDLGALQSGSTPDVQAAMLLLAVLLAASRYQGMASPLAGAGAPGQQQPGQAGGEIELKQGETFTTPSGSTISFQGDEVKIHETGQSASAAASAAGGPGGGEPGRRFALVVASAAAAAASGGEDGAAASASASASTGLQTALQGLGPLLCGPAGAASSSAAAELKPRDWRVWGDPHIEHPDGSKSDFDKKNALFTLQDGTRVLMMADNPQAVVKSVKIFLPGARVNLGAAEPDQTSIMQDKNGRFQSVGTADKFMRGGFR